MCNKLPTNNYLEVVKSCSPCKIIFNGAIQKITFIAITIISFSIGLALLTSAIILNMPLLCIGWFFIVSIILISLFFLSNLSKIKKTPSSQIEEKINNITNIFNPKIDIKSLSSQINEKTSQEKIEEILKKLQQRTEEKLLLQKKEKREKLLKQLEQEISSKTEEILIECQNKGEQEDLVKTRKTLKELRKQGMQKIEASLDFFVIMDIIGPPIFPVTARKNSTAIVSYTDTENNDLLSKCVSSQSWNSSINPFLQEGAISSGFFEYESPLHQQKFPFVKLLIQAKGIKQCKLFSQTTIPLLKATYLNIFSICEKEGIKVVQIPSDGLKLTLAQMNLNEEQLSTHIQLAKLYEKVALLEAINEFCFESVKAVLLVK